MEKEIGTIITIERNIGLETIQVKLQVVESSSCEDCYFYRKGCFKDYNKYGFCSNIYRRDKKDVSFVEVESKT